MGATLSRNMRLDRIDAQIADSVPAKPLLTGEIVEVAK
jgi:hypothetical protein